MSELDFHFLKEKVHTGIILLLMLLLGINLQTFFTNALGKQPHWHVLSKLGVHNPCAPPTCGTSSGSNAAEQTTA